MREQIQLNSNEKGKFINRTFLFCTFFYIDHGLLLISIALLWEVFSVDRLLLPFSTAL